MRDRDQDLSFAEFELIVFRPPLAGVAAAHSSDDRASTTLPPTDSNKRQADTMRYERGQSARAAPHRTDLALARAASHRRPPV